MHNPSDAKKLGRDLTLRPDWEKVKVYSGSVVKTKI